MRYVFDTSPLSSLFKNYYRRRFPTLWQRFDALVDNEIIGSTREVQHEVQNGPVEALRTWAAEQADFFPTPNANEGRHIAKIFAVPHFQQIIEQQKILKGGRVADPFVIARAMAENCAVVSLEVLKPNAAKIPNICQHFGVRCLSLEEFMEQEGWEF